jgi:photosynthetic reaction center cytochrome c subunit
MSGKIRLAVCCLFGLIFCWSAMDRLAGNAQGQKTSNPPPTAKPTSQEGFGNVQVLKGVHDLLPTMHFIRASLGVRCDYCHVTELNKYRLDDKPAKIRAREMIIMTRQMNEASFGGKNVITCNTCHRGSPKPVPVPQIVTDVVNTTRRESFEPPPPTFPSVNEILANYEAATHTGTIPAAQFHVEGLRGKLINGGTPTARMLPREEKFTTDVLVDGERGTTTTPSSNGQVSRVGSIGGRVWVKGANGPAQWITAGNLAQLKRKINPLLVLRVRAAEFSSITVAGEEKINGVDCYKLAATAADGSTEALWFAKRDHLLVRRTFYHETMLGPEPEQYDISEYKRFDAVQLPTVINASYLDDQHLGVLKRLTNLKLGVTVTDKDFEPPLDQ